MPERLVSKLVDYINPKREISPPQENQKLPFRIRGHHIGAYSWLTKGVVSPSEYAKTGALMYKHRRNVSRDAGEISGIIDTIGSTRRQLRRYEENLKHTYERFMELPPEYPIELIEGEKDEICEHCVVGKGTHCTIKYYNPAKPKNNNITGDGKDLDQFLQQAFELNLMDDVSLEYDTAEFSDTSPEQVRVIKTTAATVKTVLTNWKFSL